MYQPLFTLHESPFLTLQQVKFGNQLLLCYLIDHVDLRPIAAMGNLSLKLTQSLQVTVETVGQNVAYIEDVDSESSKIKLYVRGEPYVVRQFNEHQFATDLRLAYLAYTSLRQYYQHGDYSLFNAVRDGGSLKVLDFGFKGQQQRPSAQALALMLLKLHLPRSEFKPLKFMSPSEQSNHATTLLQRYNLPKNDVKILAQMLYDSNLDWELLGLMLNSQRSISNSQSINSYIYAVQRVQSNIRSRSRKQARSFYESLQQQQSLNQTLEYLKPVYQKSAGMNGFHHPIVKRPSLRTTTPIKESFMIVRQDTFGKSEQLQDSGTREESRRVCRTEQSELGESIKHTPNRRPSRNSRLSASEKNDERVIKSLEPIKQSESQDRTFPQLQQNYISKGPQLKTPMVQSSVPPISEVSPQQSPKTPENQQTPDSVAQAQTPQQYRNTPFLKKSIGVLPQFPPSIKSEIPTIGMTDDLNKYVEEYEQKYRRTFQRINVLGKTVAKCIKVFDAYKNLWIMPLFIIFKRMYQIRVQIHEDLSRQVNKWNMENFQAFTKSDAYKKLVNEISQENFIIQKEVSQILENCKSKISKLDKNNRYKIEPLLTLDRAANLQDIAFVYLYSQINNKVAQLPDQQKLQLKVLYSLYILDNAPYSIELDYSDNKLTRSFKSDLERRIESAKQRLQSKGYTL